MSKLTERQYIFNAKLQSASALLGPYKTLCANGGVSVMFARTPRSTRILNVSIHQENMSMLCALPQTPLLYSKTGVCRGIPIFLIFAPKHRLWVLVRTRRGGSNVYLQSMFCAKIRKIAKLFY